MMLSQAFQLKKGDYIHTPDRFNADGTPMRARITSIKTWKTRPNQIEIHYKRGLYEYGSFREYELDKIEFGYGS